MKSGELRDRVDDDGPLDFARDGPIVRRKRVRIHLGFVIVGCENQNGVSPARYGFLAEAAPWRRCSRDRRPQSEFPAGCTTISRQFHQPQSLTLPSDRELPRSSPPQALRQSPIPLSFCTFSRKSPSSISPRRLNGVTTGGKIPLRLWMISLRVMIVFLVRAALGAVLANNSGHALAAACGRFMGSSRGCPYGPF